MFDHFTATLPPYAFVCAPYICKGKLLRISNDFSEAAGPTLLKFHVESPWYGERKVAKMVARGPLTKIAAM